MANYNVTGPVYFDMEFVYGSNWQVDYTAKDGEGTAIDLSGSPTIKFRVSSISGTTLMTRTVSDGITVTGTGTGLFSLNVTAAMQATASVSEGARYLYETQVTTTGTSGTVYTIARGHLNVTPSLIA